MGTIDILNSAKLYLYVIQISNKSHEITFHSGRNIRVKYYYNIRVYKRKTYKSEHDKIL